VEQETKIGLHLGQVFPSKTRRCFRHVCGFFNAGFWSQVYAG